VTSERDDLAELGRYAFTRLRSRLDGVTEDEYRWQPAPGVSSLAWRLGHLTDLLADGRNAAWLGVLAGAPPTPAADVAGAIAALEQAHTGWTSVLAAVPDGALGEAVGPVGGLYADSTKRAYVLHVLDELVHHAAEVALIRDLWAGLRTAPDPGRPG
jgi:DinB family protein